MGVFLIWGTDFEVQTSISSSGAEDELYGTDGGWAGLSATSVTEMVRLASTYGVPEDLWPSYDECGGASELPLDDARAKSAALRREFDKLPDHVVEHDRWLGYLVPKVRDGHVFLIIGVDAWTSPASRRR